MRKFPNWNFFPFPFTWMHSVIWSDCWSSWWSVWPLRILFFSVLKKLSCSKKHLLLFTMIAGRGNVVFKTHEPWSPSLFPGQSQGNATDFWIRHHSSQWPRCFPFHLHAALKNAGLYVLSQKLWLKTDNQHFKRTQPITVPKCPGAVQLQRGGSNQRSKLSKKQ